MSGITNEPDTATGIAERSNITTAMNVDLAAGAAAHVATEQLNTQLMSQVQSQQQEIGNLRKLVEQLQDRLTNVLAATEASLPTEPESTRDVPVTNLRGPDTWTPPDRTPGIAGYVKPDPVPTSTGRYHIKINEPVPYDGQPNNDPREWVMEVRDYIGFHTLRGPPLGENEKVLIAATYLKSDAKRRWNAERVRLETIQAHDPNSPALNFTFEQFLTWVSNEFKDVNREERDRLAYTRCRQGDRRVAQYVTEFRARAARVEPSPGDRDMKDRFKDGLSPTMKVEITRVRPEPVTSREYMAVAEQLDQTLRAAARETQMVPRAGRDNQVFPRTTRYTDGLRVPGAYRAITGGKVEQVNAIEAISETTSDNGSVSDDEQLSDVGSHGSDSALAAITSEQIQCYSCKQLGHISRNCPNRSSGRKQAGKVPGRA
ncbi:hypothetical protein OC846_006672 [Tilletia horrida]|uniref:CCHC-type domain-containing protein n=1 Tax=Tilletia horrida TaxID=155126 RepID=A0AAN6GL78_9BASI|nr:hypothetical protein OC846_006672 [Tilletia horrida]